MLSKLKRNILAAFPVVGPHADIEAELMLSGKKPLTWLHIPYPDWEIPKNVPITSDNDWREVKEAHGTIELDKAVSKEKLISEDVAITKFPNLNEPPPHTPIVRHYAQIDQSENLSLIASINRSFFNFQEPDEAILEAAIGKDFGDYLGYRRRDILFFNKVINNPYLPRPMAQALIELNSYSQAALREKLLEESGYDVKEWRQNLPCFTPPNP